MVKASYTRTRGRELVYEIEADTQTYRISLDGRLLKLGICQPCASFPSVRRLERLHAARARCDIEMLDGMPEE